MNFLKTYETFYEPIYSCVCLNNNDMNELSRNDKTLEKRIRFFNYDDYMYSNDPLYFVLFGDEKIIGICKIDIFKHEKADYTISYFSIDRKHRNNKLTKLIIETLFIWLKNNNKSLSSSSWTVPGNLKLRPLLNKMSKEFGVNFQDNNRKFDNENNYNKNLINSLEMTDSEYKKFQKK
jgi:hypothetical protein